MRRRRKIRNRSPKDKFNIGSEKFNFKLQNLVVSQSACCCKEEFVLRIGVKILQRPKGNKLLY